MSSTSTPEYDIIIAGGGAAGGVIAGRLATADPSLKILVLEAGGHTKDDIMHTQPARYLAHLVPTSKTVKFYVGQQSEHLGGRSPIVPVGNCLGGGSSVNFAMYTRASASDYDDWELEYGNPGWGYKDLLPLLKKTETYQVKENEQTHGYDGPLHVSYGGAFTNVGKAFLEVAAQYDPERGRTEDAQNLATGDAYARWAKWVSSVNGRRSDVAHHFLYNQADNHNLVIDVGCIVKRVIFEGKRAVGIEYFHNPEVRPDAEVQTLHTARAKKLVVVSAGAFGSPQILERSGVGAPQVLDKIGVETVVDLPGVGENYQDHQGVFVPYVASDEADTIDGILRSEEGEIQKWGDLWKNEGTGLMAHNGIDGGGKFRLSASEVEEIGPAFKSRWQTFYQGRGQDKPVYIMGALSLLVGDISTAPVRKYFSIGGFLAYPSSTGYVHCTTTDVNASPEFDPGYFSKEDDAAVVRLLYKKGREFARRMWPYRGEYAPGHPQFPQGSSVAPAEGRMPVDANVKDLEYSEEDEEAITRYLKAAVGTTWHSMGTCAMKPRESGGVVDSRLNVYGTEGLKVADMSIAPGNVGSNTYSTALVIGEKAAVIIAEELGLTNV